MAQWPSGTIATALPTFSWNSVTGADHYYFWITDATTGQNVVKLPLVTKTSATLTQALTLGHTYTWWVGAVSTNNLALTWNSSLNFTVAPTAHGPSGTIATDLPVFTWNSVTGAASYSVYLTDQTTGVTVVTPIPTGTSWTPSQPLALGDSYIWWAGAVNGQTTAWSSSLTFRIAPTASGPSGTIATGLPTFSWNSVTGASSYSVYLTDQTTGVTVVTPIPTGTSWTPSQPLTLGDSFVWWAGAVNGQTTAWSSSLTFRIAPTASGPSGTIATGLPTFSWNSVTGASSYSVYLTDQTTGVTVVTPIPTGTTWTPSQPLTLGDSYIWWAGAVNGQSTGWSAALTFRIAPTALTPNGSSTGTLPTYTWSGVTGVFYYYLWVTDLNTGVNVVNLPYQTGTSATPQQALTLGDTYIWWIGAIQFQNTIWSSSVEFTVTG